jgi:hypothetical protein
MDLSQWISSDVASLRQRLTSGFIDLVEPDRWRERVDGGGIAPVYVAWHVARHHDVAVNLVIRRAGQVLDRWSDRVGIDGDTWRGLAEGEDHELVDALDPDAVAGYLQAVLDHTIEWLGAETLPDLEQIPDSAAALQGLGTPEDRFGWLFSMWNDKPAQFYLQWEAVGHGYNHLGELISIRNRMGLSPF